MRQPDARSTTCSSSAVLPIPPRRARPAPDSDPSARCAAADPASRTRCVDRAIRAEDRSWPWTTPTLLGTRLGTPTDARAWPVGDLRRRQQQPGRNVMKIVVIGGSGRVGSNVVRQLD